MKIIYKYHLSIVGTTTIYMPMGSIIISIGEQDNQPKLWAEVEKDKPSDHERLFKVVPTGGYLHGHEKYLGSFTLNDGDRFVGHVYEVPLKFDIPLTPHKGLKPKY